MALYEDRADPTRRRLSAAASRLWGIAIVVVAFIVLIAELRYLGSRGLPSATGSLRGSWGQLILLGLPCVVLVAGALQAISGIAFHNYSSVFSNQTLARKISTSVAAVAIALTAIVLATLIG